VNFTPTLLAEAEAAWKRRAAQPAPAKKRRGGRKHPVPRPFLKWVGGKGHLVPELKRRIPRDFDGTYHEPFVGGGALFFALQPDRAHLSDNNLRLVRTYRAIRDDVDAVIARLEQLPHDKELFLQLRREPIDECPDDATVAAWMLYLNKTAFNGLYRVNSRNIYNVPFGRYTNPLICDDRNLRACHQVLQGVEIDHEPFFSVRDRAVAGDFVYFDPPYIPLSATSNFTSYTDGAFGDDEQVRLRDVALELKERGVRVLLSNSSADRVRELYTPGFRKVETVPVPRRVNSKGSGRGAVDELLIS
jgi:DNA adenine methylase